MALKKFRLIYDKDQEELIHKSVLPLVHEIIESKHEFNSETIEPFAEGQNLMLYLSDSQIKEMIPFLINKDLPIAILPHPQAREACLGMGVSRKLEQAIDFLVKRPETIQTDILYCNDIPVFNNVVVGQTFELTSEDPTPGTGFFRRKFFHLKRFFNMKTFLVDLDLPNNKNIKTAVVGIVISEHRKSSMISRIVLEDSSIRDGKMHAFLISPRSVLEMLVVAITSIWRKSKLPPFAAHIKVASIDIKFPTGQQDFLIDNVKYKNNKLEIRSLKETMCIFPGQFLEITNSTAHSAEIIKIKSLPIGEAARELSENRIPLTRHASTEEFKGLFQTLRDNAKLKGTYLVLMVLSTILATFGLFANSTPVVIGAMILAPLMAPIISLSMGTLRQDRKLITNSFTTILAGLGLSVLFAVIITWITPLNTPGTEILTRTRPNLLDLGIAVVAGIAGAYAHAREEVAKTLAGVAIAVALIPPLAVAAIGIGWRNWDIFYGAALLLTTNLTGMVLAGSITFWLLGFSPFKLVNRGMFISLILVLLLCIPLALGFRQMVEEHQITNELKEIETEIAIMRDLSVQRMNPLTISVKFVSENEISNSDIDLIKAMMEKRIGQEIVLEVTTAVVK